METRKDPRPSAQNKPRFPLGFVVATPGPESALSPADVAEALARHAAGDWGELCAEDRQANEHALACGGRLLSVYRTRGSGERFYVVTEADRSTTTLMLPAEY